MESDHSQLKGSGVFFGHGCLHMVAALAEKDSRPLSGLSATARVDRRTAFPFLRISAAIPAARIALPRSAPAGLETPSPRAPGGPIGLRSRPSACPSLLSYVRSFGTRRPRENCGGSARPKRERHSRRE